MQNIGATLTPNTPWPFQVRGTVLQIISSGNSAGLTVQFLLGSQVQYTIEGALTGWKIRPAGGFDSITIQSATGDTISAIVTAGDVDIQVIETSVEVTNASGNPVPVAVVSGTINMTATNVGINNTSANPVPVTMVSEPGAPFQVEVVPASTTATDDAPVAVTTGGVTLIAAGARKGLRVRNAGAGQLAITAAGGTTFANAALVLQPGDVWNETDAPQIQWYAISDVGTTANIQVVA